MREKLPDRRNCITFEVVVNYQALVFSVGLYEDGRPGEVFIDLHRTGTALRSWSGAAAKLISLMLQYGVPLHEIVGALAGHGSEPWGEVPVTGHRQIKTSTGVLDTIVRALALEFLADELHREGFDASDSTSC